MSADTEAYESAFYARREIREFRNIARYSDYKKIKADLLRKRDVEPGTTSRRVRMRPWFSWMSESGWTAVIAIGTVALVLLTAALLAVALL